MSIVSICIPCHAYTQAENARFLSVGRAGKRWVGLSAIGPGFFEQCIPGFLRVATSTPAYSNTPLAEVLYTPHGSSSAAVPSSYAASFAMDGTETHLVLKTVVPSFGFDEMNFQRMRASALVDAGPAFDFSRFPDSGFEAAVSFPTLVRATAGDLSSVDQLGVDSLLINLAEATSDSVLDGLAAAFADRGLLVSRCVLHFVYVLVYFLLSCVELILTDCVPGGRARRVPAVCACVACKKVASRVCCMHVLCVCGKR